MDASSRQKLHKKLSLDSFLSTTTSSSQIKPKYGDLTRNILIKNDPQFLDCSRSNVSNQFGQFSTIILQDMRKATKVLPATADEILPTEEKTEVNVFQKPKVKLRRSQAFRRTNNNPLGEKSQILGASCVAVDGNHDELQNRRSLKTPIEEEEATTSSIRYEHSLSSTDDTKHEKENTTGVITGRNGAPLLFSYQAPVVQATRYAFSFEMGKQANVSNQEHSVRRFHHEQQAQQVESDEEDEDDDQEEKEMAFDDVTNEVISPDEVKQTTVRMCRPYRKVNFIVVQGTDNDSLGFVQGIAKQNGTEKKHYIQDSTHLQEDILFHEYLRKRPSRRLAVCEQIEKCQIEAKINGIKMTTFDLRCDLIEKNRNDESRVRNKV